MSPEKFFSSAYQNVLATENDIFIKQSLVKQESHLFSDDVYKIVNSNSVYNYEKSNSSTYRMTFTLDVYASNVLFNITSDDSYTSLVVERIYVPEENEFTFTEEEIMFEENGWLGYLTGLAENEGCSRRFFRPYPTDLSLVSNNGFYNYDIFLTYEYDKDNSISFNGIPLSDGIAIYSASTITINNRDMTKVVTPISHNLSENDTITIYDVSGGTDYFVYQLGDENNDNLNNMFVIDDLNILNELPNASLKRKVDGILSEYYITKHKKIDNNTLLYKNGFANTVYSDTIFSIGVNQELDINNYIDAFDRPLTDIFLTVVKKRNTEYDNFFFNSIKSGVYTMFANSDYDINTLTDVLGIPLENNVSLDEMYGNIVEYNKREQKLYRTEPVYHRFNSKNRANNGFHEGYYYIPHYKTSLREYSEYINESETAEASPSYAFQFNENRYIYRDLDDTNLSSVWPFTNNNFYVYNKFSLFLRRQDPCFLYIAGYQNPIKGNCMDFSMKKIQLPQNQC